MSLFWWTGMNIKLAAAAVISVLVHSLLFFVPAAFRETPEKENFIKYNVALAEKKTSRGKLISRRKRIGRK